jgi:hypothetical protein
MATLTFEEFQSQVISDMGQRWTPYMIKGFDQWQSRSGTGKISYSFSVPSLFAEYHWNNTSAWTYYSATLSGNGVTLSVAKADEQSKFEA